MRVLARCMLLAAAVLAILQAAGQPAGTEPRYDPATVVTVRMIVAEVRDVAKGQPLPGIHLMARPESAKVDSEPWDVYIGPAAFLKSIDLAFHARDKMDVVGSKIKTPSGMLILARQIRQSGTELNIRDDRGEPLWKALLEGGH